MKSSTVVRLFAVVLLVAVTASAGRSQNPALAPTFGAANLRVGFVPDPYTVAIVAGGGRQITVNGFKMSVANAPDFSINYTAGVLPLTFYVRSAADTTLLINLPNGTWIADDDSDGNLNPGFKINRPMSGRYDVWVGTFAGGNPRATLYISELR